ncbi:SDR family oxidoreductase [Actibacterium sp.]|uniref:SDR family oxidoreductase n=1 Tax=Actibacterium sp. TaxID=1872125 RepID=UPI003564EC34
MKAGKALVTGAGKRLGRAMALHLASRGFDVAVHYNSSAEDALAVVDQITAMGRKAVALGADLLNDAETETLFPRAVQALGGPLTVLINNASIFEYDNLATATRESWDRHMQSNLRAPFILTQAFAAQGLNAGQDDKGEQVAVGLIVNMIDQRVNKLTPEFMTYTLAKMGLWALTRTSAQALGPAIRVNAIGPGPTLIGARQTQEHFDSQRASTILQRGADEDDVTAALEYLLMARSVTGQIVCTDGGQHLTWQTKDIFGIE